MSKKTGKKKNGEEKVSVDAAARLVSAVQHAGAVKQKKKKKANIQNVVTDASKNARATSTRNMGRLIVGTSGVLKEHAAMLRSLTLPGVAPPVRVSVPSSEALTQTALFRFNQERTLDLATYYDNQAEYTAQLGHMAGAIQGYILHAFHDPRCPLMVYRRTTSQEVFTWTGTLNTRQGEDLVIGYGQSTNPMNEGGIIPLRPTGFYCMASDSAFEVGQYKDFTTFYIPACANSPVTVDISWSSVTGVTSAGDFTVDVVVYALGRGQNEEPDIVASAGVYTNAAYSNSLVIKSPTGSAWPYANDTRIYCVALNVGKMKTTNTTTPVLLKDFLLGITIPANSWVPRYLEVQNSIDLLANSDRVRLWGNAYLISPETATVWTGGVVRAYDLTQFDSPFTTATSFPQNQSMMYRSAPFPWPTGIYGWVATRSAPILTDYTPDERVNFGQNPMLTDYNKVSVVSMLPHDGARLPYGCHRIVISAVVTNRNVGDPLPFLVVSSLSGEFTNNGQLFQLKAADKHSNYSEIVYDIQSLPKWTHNPIHIGEFLGAVRKAVHWSAGKVGPLAKILTLLNVPGAAGASAVASALEQATGD